MKTKLLKFLWLIAFFLIPVSIFALQTPIKEVSGTDPFPIDLVLLILAALAGAFGLLAPFAVHLVRNKSVDKKREPLWFLGFYLLGFIFVPLYWWEYIWPSGEETGNEGDDGRSNSGKAKRKFGLSAKFMTILVIFFIGFMVYRGFNTKLTPQDVIESFEDAGLEVGDYRPLTEDDSIYLTYSPDDGIKFFLSSSTESQFGLILYYEDEIELEATKDFYEELGEHTTEGYLSGVFVHENILVQLIVDSDEAKLAQYGLALHRAGD